MNAILLVDDNTTERRLLYHALKADYRIVEAADPDEALARLEREKIDLVLLDMHLPPHTENAEGGMRLQRAIRERYPALPVVIVTGDRDRGLALEMVQSGVADFLLKPVEPEVVKIVATRALARSELEHELHRLREQVRERFSFGSLVGQSRTIRAAFEKLEKLARSDTSVLLLGESGTGKSTVARTLHHEGRRSDGPFVIIDPSTIPASLMESELFGHVKGAFTGADSDKVGRVHAADGGTLFLDEIGNLDQHLQAKLLLFLDERRLTPVGSQKEIPVDVRLVAATNRDLDAMVREGRFREDLLYRIQVATVLLPPLRERPEDIESLANHLLPLICDETGRPPSRLTPEALRLLRQYSWPGNVRQLKHVLESSLVLADGDVLDATDLTLPESGGAAESAPGGERPFKDRVAALEKQLVVEALEKSGGNKAAAGRALGLDENQIRYLCRKYGL